MSTNISPIFFTAQHGTAAIAPCGQQVCQRYTLIILDLPEIVCNCYNQQSVTTVWPVCVSHMIRTEYMASVRLRESDGVLGDQGDVILAIVG